MLNRYYRFAVEKDDPPKRQSRVISLTASRRKIVIYLDIPRRFYVWGK